jgi:hypothetical protein
MSWIVVSLLLSLSLVLSFSVRLYFYYYLYLFVLLLFLFFSLVLCVFAFSLVACLFLRLICYFFQFPFDISPFYSTFLISKTKRRRMKPHCCPSVSLCLSVCLCIPPPSCLSEEISRLVLPMNSCLFFHFSFLQSPDLSLFVYFINCYLPFPFNIYLVSSVLISLFCPLCFFWSLVYSLY